MTFMPLTARPWRPKYHTITIQTRLSAANHQGCQNGSTGQGKKKVAGMGPTIRG